MGYPPSGEEGAELGALQIGILVELTEVPEEAVEAGFNPFVDNPDAYGWQWFIFLNVMTILLQFSYGPYLQQYAAMDKPKTVSRSYLLGAIFGFGRGLVIFGLGVATVAALGKMPPADMAGAAMSATEWATPVPTFKV